MARQDYYSFSKSYPYTLGPRFDGMLVDADEGPETVSGEVTWSADISWDDALGQYQIDLLWEDDNFSDFGEGPKEDDFMDDLFAYLEGQGIDSEEVTY